MCKRLSRFGVSNNKINGSDGYAMAMVNLLIPDIYQLSENQFQSIKLLRIMFSNRKTPTFLWSFLKKSVSTSNYKLLKSFFQVECCRAALRCCQDQTSPLSVKNNSNGDGGGAIHRLFHFPMFSHFTLWSPEVFIYNSFSGIFPKKCSFPYFCGNCAIWSY